MEGGFGYFGKIPSQGDFLRGGLSPTFLDPWDTWLQRAIVTAREALGPAWQAAYTSAPIWRFALSPGVCGPSGAIGVVMPSIDRVGRQFPLTLAVETGEAHAWPAYRAADALFAPLEEVALSMLDDDAGRDGLEAGLDGLAVQPAGADGREIPLGRAAIEGIGDPQRALADRLIAQEGRLTLWGSEVEGTQRLIACDGMPGFAEIPTLFAITAAPWTSADAQEAAE
ncbi:MAG: type VI secretion system-associated protein TagF [Pseudomonadota bacterium]